MGQRSTGNHSDHELFQVRPGRKGLRITDGVDILDPEEAVDLINLRSRFGQPLESRPGQTVVAEGAGAVPVHTLVRMDDPTRNDWLRWGVAGNKLAAGKDQASGFTDLSTLFGTALSGRPCTLLPYRAPISGEPWLLIADASGMYRARWNGTEFQAGTLGIEAPVAKQTAEIVDILRGNICSFDDSQGTAANDWTKTSGRDFSEEPIIVGAAPTAVDESMLQGNGVKFTFLKGAAKAGYYSWVGCPKPMDLTKLNTIYDSEDDDYVNLWLKLDQPHYVEEVRVYIVCDPSFDPAVIPGTSSASNQQAFVHTLRPHDFTGYTEVAEDELTAAERSRENDRVNDYLAQNGTVPQILVPAQTPEDVPVWVPMVVDPTGAYQPPGPATDGLPTQTSSQFGVGRDIWSQFGTYGRPLRKKDFLRMGADPDRGWQNCTGIVILIRTTTNQDVNLSCDDWYITGGWGVDSGPADANDYDYRYTHYDLRTGVESNPSPTFEEPERVKALRQRIRCIGEEGGWDECRQRFYRRGGYIVDAWRFVGMSDSDGGEYIDEWRDGEIEGANELMLDNDRPVQTVNLAGEIVRANLDVLFGPVDGLLMGCGDPYAPGFLYWSKSENPDAWPTANVIEVCPPSEELMNGVIYGSAAYVFSRSRMYSLTPNIVSGGGVVATPTGCAQGLACKWGVAVTPMGIAFVAQDGIRMTTGGDSQLISAAIEPLFRGGRVYGDRLPINLTLEDYTFLTYWDDELWFHYRDTLNRPQCLVLDLIGQQWRAYNFAYPVRRTYPEPTGGKLLMGSDATGILFEHSGYRDREVTIHCRYTSPYYDLGNPRADKQWGDMVFDAQFPEGTPVDVTVRHNNGTVKNEFQRVIAGEARLRYHFDSFGEITQRSHNMSVQLEWRAGQPVIRSGDILVPPVASQIHYIGLSYIGLPEQTMNRPTIWDEQTPSAGYVYGMVIDCDTNGDSRTVFVEATISQSKLTIATLEIASPGRRRLYFTWPVRKVDFVRLRPADECQWWILYNITWLALPEPPRTTRWESGEEHKGDTYYTGLDLVIDTFGATKDIQVYADGELVLNPQGGDTFPVVANGKQQRHLTFGPGRAHIYRFIALDNNPGYLYSWEWQLQGEPQEQHNWNQNFTTSGTLTDKWLKGLLIECDTFGREKTLEIQVDGVTLQTVHVVTSDRKVAHLSFPQVKGRVFRMLPVDHNPGRLYTLQWIFDEEPLGLDRWETQELDHGITGWFVPLEAFITLRSEADVTLNITLHNQVGVVLSSTDYVLPRTDGVKVKRWVPFYANKGCLVKYLFTSAIPFALYREESGVVVQPWGAAEPGTLKPFGNDDLDLVRGMQDATLTSARQGGGRG